MPKVFLGGTCNDSTWRDELIPMLDIDYFNPVVKDWTPADQENELKERATCDFVLYTITPLMAGVYSIAEAVDDSNKRPEKTVFLVLPEDRKDDESVQFSNANLKSLVMCEKMIAGNGAKVCDSLQEVADYLNEKGNK